MDGIQSMSIDTESIRSWCIRAQAFSFSSNDSVYVSDLTLSRSTPFGLTSQGSVFVLLDDSLYDASFRIRDLIELTRPKKFYSDDDGRTLYGIGLLIKSGDIDSRTRVLTLIDRLLSADDYKADLDEFFELLRRASQRGTGFHAPSLYGELIVLKALVGVIPDIVMLWRSSGMSVMDICASDVSPEIEVKSTTNLDSRRHIMSLHQLRHFLDNERCVLASVQVHEDSSGTSCKDLCVDLMALSGGESSDASRILNSYLVALAGEHEFHAARFNEALTMSSIAFLRPFLGELGMAVRQPPPWLTSASFEIDFSIVQAKEIFIG